MTGAQSDTGDPRARIGVDGEDAAAAFLAARGWRVIARNARTRFGELDLVCCAEGSLVFVEVKALRGSGRQTAARALESIGPRKQRQIRKLARSWLAENRAACRYTQIRFDAIGISLGAGGRPNGVEHVPAAF